MPVVNKMQGEALGVIKATHETISFNFPRISAASSHYRSYLSQLKKPLVGRVYAQEDENRSDDDRGFGKGYKWKYIGQGFAEAKKMDKPIFLIVHRDTCPACQKLKEKFSNSIQLIDLSNQFVMVNVPAGTDVLSLDKKFQPDGHYVPRILFYTPQGEIINEAYNRHATDSKFRYFYSNPNDIAEVMRNILKNYQTSAKS